MPVTLQPTIFKYKDENGNYQSATCISGEAIVKTVSGTTPTIVADNNTRYICGEISSLNFTPCASGICDVVFESGSTPTVLTITPPTGVTAVKWANGFDLTTLDANTIYEINILDGKYGVAGIWT